ncbi:MAG: hypothetical protein OXG60_08500 [Chloroflexi bacterium]|nr:hypothetical protein [Chloroflexota bacterium]
MTIDIPEDVALRLEQLAEQHDTDLGDLLRDMIERYAKERPTDDKRWATLADLARNAKEAGLASPHPVNTAARSREILNTEYVDYLKRRKSR